MNLTAGHRMRSHWKRLHEQHVGPFNGNVHRDAAQLRPIVEDIGFDACRDIIDFYFEVDKSPDFMWFLYNYDKLQDELARRTEDREHRKTLREATRRRMEELQNQSRDQTT